MSYVLFCDCLCSANVLCCIFSNCLALIVFGTTSETDATTHSLAKSYQRALKKLCKAEKDNMSS